MYSIFVSYRRSDSSGYAGRLYDRLSARFGSISVFIDTESLQLGSDWLEAILGAQRTCRIVLVVIGRTWVQGLIDRARLPSVDLLHVEVSEALKKPSIRVIPVLVGGAAMPTRAELPDDLSDLAGRQALYLDDNHFGLECDILIQEIERVLSENARHANTVAMVTRRGVADVVVADLKDLQMLGWSTTNLIEKLLALEYDMMQGLTLDFAGTGPQWAPILEAHPETWRVLLNTEREIIANWHFVALRPEDFKRARAGKLLEREITPDKACHIDLKGFHSVYVVAAFIVPRCRQLHTLQLFRASMLDHFLFLAKQDVFLDIICANAYTKEGEAFCKSFEMLPGRRHAQRGRMYERRLFPLPASLAYSRTKELNRLYERAIAKRSG